MTNIKCAHLLLPNPPSILHWHTAWSCQHFLQPPLETTRHPIFLLKVISYIYSLFLIILSYFLPMCFTPKCPAPHTGTAPHFSACWHRPVINFTELIFSQILFLPFERFLFFVTFFYLEDKGSLGLFFARFHCSSLYICLQTFLKPFNFGKLWSISLQNLFDDLQ